MTLSGAYTWGFGLTMSLALLGVLMGGAMPVWLWLALAVPPLSAWLRARNMALSGALGTVAAALALILGVGILFQRGVSAALLAAGLTLTLLLVVRLLTRETLDHDLQALLISLLLVFAGSVLHTQVTYGFIFVSYAVTIVWALVTRQLVGGAHYDAQRRGGARVEVTLARKDIATPLFVGVIAALALAILSSTTVLFLLFPRIGIGNWRVLAQMGGGFPSDVSLHGDPRGGLGGGRVMARVSGLTYAQFERGLYLRGPIYDAIVDGAFVATAAPSELTPSRLKLTQDSEEMSYQVFMQPVLGNLLLTLGYSRGARIMAGGQINPSHQTRMLGVGPQGQLRTVSVLSSAIRYAVEGRISEQGRAPQGRGSATHDARDTEVVRHFTATPDDLDRRIGALALEIVGASDDRDGGAQSRYQQVSKLRRFLLREFEYSLEQANGGTDDPLASFLFDDRSGHCEYFATAFAMLLRTVGIPSRVVGGLQGGQWEPQGEVVVFTSKHAHAWIEWYSPGAGWVTDDATPATESERVTLGALAGMVERMRRAWDDYIVDYGVDHQIEIFKATTRNLNAAWLKFDKASVKRYARAATTIVVALVLLALATWWLLRRRLRPRQGGQIIFDALMAARERLGVPPLEDDRTAREGITTVPTDCPEHARSILRQGLALYERAQFGSESIDAATLRLWVRRLGEVG